MKKLGLIGFPLGHSFSAKYFNAKFNSDNLSDWSYHNFAIESVDMIDDILAKEPALKGFNVTIPHKVAIIDHLHEIDDLARKIGAVNCVKVTRNGGSVSLKGYNTDIVGFKTSLLEMIKEQRPKALVLGTGGASKAVSVALDDLGISYIIVSRVESKNGLSYQQLLSKDIKEHKLIINTTPLGMFPNIDAAPEIDYNAIGMQHFIYDLIFNPHETKFMKMARVQGATVKNGYEMLINQAEAWWGIIYEPNC